MKEIKMLKLPLQFFGENGGGDDDFTEDFFEDIPEYYETDEGEEDAADDDADDSADDGADNDADNDADDNADDGANGGADNGSDGGSDDNADTDTQSENDDAQGANDDLISELRALGYVGNDLAALTADMKKKREAQAAQDAKREAAATKAAGKNHIRSGKPGKSASGDGTGGVNERRVISFAESAGISKERAREMLAKHARLIEGK